MHGFASGERSCSRIALCAVILACRDSKKGNAVAKEVEAAQVAAGFSAQTQVVMLDQSSVESAEECANEVAATNNALNILINNGGIYDMGGGIPNVKFHPAHIYVSKQMCANMN